MDRKSVGLQKYRIIQFTGTAWLLLCSRSSRRPPGPPAGPCRIPVQMSRRRHRSAALAPRDPRSRRREEIVDHRSMTAISMRGESRPCEEEFLPVEDGRMAARSRSIQYIRCCVQSPGGTQPMPWMECERPRCYWSLPEIGGLADCQSRDWEHGHGVPRGSSPPWGRRLAGTRKTGEKKRFGALQLSAGSIEMHLGKTVGPECQDP